jgi:uncharacterized membrane protein
LKGAVPFGQGGRIESQAAMLKRISLNVMIFTYLFAGTAHFYRMDYFASLLPPFLPSSRVFAALTGILYILLSLLLVFPRTRNGACYGILLVLAIGIPLDVFLWISDSARGAVPRDIVLGRALFKAPLMAWAYWHSRKGLSRTGARL